MRDGNKTYNAVVFTDLALLLSVLEIGKLDLSMIEEDVVWAYISMYPATSME